MQHSNSHMSRGGGGGGGGGDPAQVGQDALPQPYRMIVRLLEMEVFDRAWLDITRLHPELLQNSDGEPLSLKPNYALNNICTPAAVLEQTFSATSMVEKCGLLFMTTNGNAFIIVDPIDGKVVQSMLMEPRVVRTVSEADSDAAAASPAQEKEAIMFIGGVSDSLTSDQILRFSVCRLMEVEEEMKEEEAEGGAKKPPPKKGAIAEPLPKRKVGKCFVSIVEVKLGLSGNALKSPALIKICHLAEASLTVSKPERACVGSIDVSADGTLLCVAIASGSCHLFRLPPVIASDLGTASMENITEEDDSFPHDDRVGVAIAPLTLIPDCTLTEAHIGKRLCQAAYLVPLTAASAPLLESASQINKKPHAMQEPVFKMGLAVIFESSPEWMMLGIKSDPLTVPVAAEASSDAAAAGGGVESAIDLGVSLTVMSVWRLAVGISALAFDEGRSILALGLRDGSLTLWNLVTRTLSPVVGKHETAVTTISLFRSANAHDKNQASYHMISGALDGTLCFFDVLVPRDSKEPFYISSISDAGTPCLSTSFSAFRFDVEQGASIVCIRSLKDLPIAIVSVSDGLSLIYDAQGAQLLGKFALYSGIVSKTVAWEIALVKQVQSIQNDPNELAIPNSSYEQQQQHVSGVLQRAGKYAVSSSYRAHHLNLLNSISIASHVGFHSIYFRNKLPVLASFKIEDIFGSLMPGLATLMRSTKGEFGSSLQMFNMLSPSERASSELATARVANYNSFANDVSMPPSSGRGKKAVVDSRGGGGSKPSSAAAAFAAVSSAPFATPRRGSGALTGTTPRRSSKGKVGMKDDASVDDSLIHDVNLRGSHESIKSAMWEGILDPSSTAIDAVRKSKNDRSSRTLRIGNQFKGLASVL